MRFFTTFFVVALAICANGYTVNEQITDKDMFLRIIECAQQAVLNGIPEIGLPVHNPLKFQENYSIPLTIGAYSFELDLENFYLEGIPFWNVTQFDDVTEIEGNPIFDYTICWKKMALGGDWKVALTETDTNDTIFKQEGTIYIQLDDLTFSGVFNFTKPSDDVEGGFNYFELHFHTQNSILEIENLGLVSTLINAFGGPFIKEAVNKDLLYPFLSPRLMKKLNNNWVKKPERIEAIITHCN